MGGRGAQAFPKGQQLSISYILQEQGEIQQIDNIIKHRKAMLLGLGGGGSLPQGQGLKCCFCCGEASLPVDSFYEICPICGWIDDDNQNKNPNSTNGKNSICLSEYRQLYFSNKDNLGK